MLPLVPTFCGSLAFLIFCVNTVFWCSLLFVVTAFRIALPFRPVRTSLRRLSSRIAECWVGGNAWGLRVTGNTVWDFKRPEGLSYGKSYLVISNHQSWVDIVAIQLCFNRRIPIPRFFIKKQLFWVPVLGLAWWALDFPFMRRYSKEFLEKHPELKGKDREAVKKACECFRGLPATLLSFAEGTRFTRAKHERQKSPYRRLLLPKAGGTASVISAMSDSLHTILDVTLAYPGGCPTFWDLLSGRVERVLVEVKERPIPDEFRTGNYEEDAGYRERFQAWLKGVWQEKDARLEGLLG